MFFSQLIIILTFAWSGLLLGLTGLTKISTSPVSYGQCDDDVLVVFPSIAKVRSQVSHYLHSLRSLCDPDLSQREANLWRGSSGEKEKSSD